MTVKSLRLPKCHWTVKHLWKSRSFGGFVKIISRNKRFSVAAFQWGVVSVTRGQYIRTHTVRVKGKNLNPVTRPYKHKQLSLQPASELKAHTHIHTCTFSPPFVSSTTAVVLLLSDVVCLTSCNYAFSSPSFPQALPFYFLTVLSLLLLPCLFSLLLLCFSPSLFLFSLPLLFNFHISIFSWTFILRPV